MIESTVVRRTWWRPALLVASLTLCAEFTMAEPFPDVDQLPVHRELPDPLVMFDGSRVTSAEQWSRQRRPELKALFAHYMYGQAPPPPTNVRGAVARVDRQFFGGKATKQEVSISFGPPGTPSIELLLIVPNRRSGPAPVFVGLNFCGNHTVVDDPTVALARGWLPERCPGCVDGRATEAGRGKQVDVWNAELIIDRGYALATCYSGDIDPDRPDFTDGVHPHYLRAGQSAAGPHEWGTIAAWAWGLSRAVDYLVTDPAIDSRRIAVVGHSRLGKTALLAAALDERIALAIPSQAGCGGTSPSRGTVGESVQRINTSFPHWFNDTFPRFNQQVERLPFDQHCLVALVAPRPVLLSNAVEDTWANPAGQFEVLQAASPVYALLGVEGLAAESMPEPGRLVSSPLGYFIRPGKHSMSRVDWQAFLDFADARLGKP